ncbi:MAG: DUF3232 domain-containing protein [Oscillospiraceae bacterium]
MIHEKIAELVAKSDKEDPDFLNIIYSAIKSCGDYVQAVNKTQAILYVKKRQLGSDEFRDEYEAADKSRTNIHNGLIVHIKMLNRLCAIAGVPAIFEGNLEKRAEVGDFAMQLVADFFEARAR